MCHEKWLLIWPGLPSSLLLVTDILVKDTKKNISLFSNKHIKQDLEFSSHSPWFWFQVLQPCRRKANIFSQWRKKYVKTQHCIYSMIVKAPRRWWTLKRKKELTFAKHIFGSSLSNGHLKYELQRELNRARKLLLDLTLVPVQLTNISFHYTHN